MRLTSILTFGAIIVASVQASAQIGGSNVWTGGTGDWALASNWSGTVAADSTDQANISAATDVVTVSVAWPQPGTDPDATLVGALRLVNGATVTINAGQTLTTDGRFGQPSLPGSGTGNYNFGIGDGGIITGDGDTFHTNDGGTFGDDGRSFLGEATFSGGGTTTFEGNVTISAPGGTDLVFARDIETQATVTSNTNNGNNRGDVVVTGSWTNSGTFNRSQTNANGNLELNGGGTFTNSGEMNVTGNNTFEVLGSGGTFSNTGTLNISSTLDVSDADIVFSNAAGASTNLDGGTIIGDVSYANATLGGNGAVTGNVMVTAGGNVTPGTSPGTLTVTGDLTVDASTVTIELGGPGTAGTDYDLLNVTGALALQNGATVAVQLINGYAGGIGDTFDILTFGSVSGLNYDFSQAIGAGAWSVDTTATSSSITFVPEPSSLAMLGLGMVGFVFRRRRS